MGEIININKKDKEFAIDAETIYWSLLERKSGDVRFDILKNKETGQIALGISENYIEEGSDDDVFTISDITILCEDSDDLLYDKLSEIMDRE